MARWTARVAPLGVESAGRVVLERDGEWKFYGSAALRTIGEDLRAVGEVHTVTVADGAIWAVGIVDDPDIAERMRSRELWPALEFGESSRYQVDEGEGALAAAVRFQSGRVAAIALVETPPWPDVWFEVERPRPA